MGPHMSGPPCGGGSLIAGPPPIRGPIGGPRPGPPGPIPGAVRISRRVGECDHDSIDTNIPGLKRSSTHCECLAHDCSCGYCSVTKDSHHSKSECSCPVQCSNTQNRLQNACGRPRTSWPKRPLQQPTAKRKPWSYHHGLRSADRSSRSSTRILIPW